MTHTIRLAAALLIGASPAACSGPAAPSTEAPLNGARIGGPFALTDQDGAPFSDRNLSGKYRIMYFGYTFCPDVCPVDVQNLAAGLRVFEGEDAAAAAKVVPVFVSIDPERDTPGVLRQFVGNFHPRMIGLTGSPQAIAAIAREYAVYYRKGDDAPGGGYMMDHSRVAYLMGPDGAPLALLPHDGTPQAIAADLKRLGVLSELFWEDTPLDRLDRGQWEALCDGCGKCCIHKLEDEETGELMATNVACKLLDRRSAQCSNYRHRHAFVAECVRLSRDNVHEIDWLPSTCAYRLRRASEPLPRWHYLVCGDREAVHRAGESVRGWTVSEIDAGELENHIVDRRL